MKQKFSIAFIGGGNMATALAKGFIGNICTPQDIYVIDTNKDLHPIWEERGVKIKSQSGVFLSNCNIWIYAIKPQDMHNAIISTQTWLNPKILVISIVAGITINTIKKWFEKHKYLEKKLIRCMPNIPVLIGKGITGLTSLESVRVNDRNLVTNLLETVGKVVWVKNDAMLDAVTALSGSGPAYILLLLEAMIDGGLLLGLDKKEATKLAFYTIHGTIELISQSHESIKKLRERISSKGGTTIAALEIFEKAEFCSIVKCAMQAAAEKSKNMGKQFNIDDNQ